MQYIVKKGKICVILRDSGSCGKFAHKKNSCSVFQLNPLGVTQSCSVLQSCSVFQLNPLGVTRYMQLYIDKFTPWGKRCACVSVFCFIFSPSHSHHLIDSSWWLLLAWRVIILIISVIQTGDCCLFQEGTFSLFQLCRLVTTTGLKSEHSHYFVTLAGDCYRLLFAESTFSPFQQCRLVIIACLKIEHSHHFSNADWWLLLVWRLNILTISAMQIGDYCLFEDMNILTISAMQIGDYCLFEDWTFSPFQQFKLVTTTCLRREHSHCFSDSSWWLLLVWRESWDIPGQKRGWTAPRAHLADLRTTGTRGLKETGTSPGSPLTFLT